jgi:hypothetical protein
VIKNHSLPVNPCTGGAIKNSRVGLTDRANLVTWFKCIVETIQTRSWLSKFKVVEHKTVRDAAAKCPLQVVGVKTFRQLSFCLGEESGLG